MYVLTCLNRELLLDFTRKTPKNNYEIKNWTLKIAVCRYHNRSSQLSTGIEIPNARRAYIRSFYAFTLLLSSIIVVFYLYQYQQTHSSSFCYSYLNLIFLAFFGVFTFSSALYLSSPIIFFFPLSFFFVIDVVRYLAAMRRENTTPPIYNMTTLSSSLVLLILVESLKF